MQGDKTSAARRTIEALPQYELVKDRVDGWLDGVQKIDPERIDWHALRLTGFGGSEIGALVRDFDSARNVVLEKLLLKLPESPAPGARRETVMEPIHRIEFLAKYGLKQDKDALQLILAAHGMLPWARHLPDDVCLSDAGKRILVGYKSPSELSKEEKFEHKAQLHLGLLLGEQAGIDFDAMVLSEMGWGAWNTNEFFVERDEDLIGRILDAGNYYWNCVLKGEVPAQVMPLSPTRRMERADVVDRGEERKERMRA